ncbi:MAG TPA: zinc dependent phospholipase C family protein [Blastocatellia bacterium]|nr:zinc dependent phospholipase C family protein [Blastocatellia bacterium]
MTGLILVLGTAPALNAYSVLSHEAVIDALWEAEIKRLLLKRFPDASLGQLRAAHAYAYGGCLIQDMGYYPFGSHFFSELVHYVRSGDFVESLIRQSQDLNEYAFALGALSHYAADNIGHPLAVNLSEPILYPKLRAKYGNVMTYAEDPKKHIMVEFGFDVVQIAAGVYVPDDYHDFIGFQVSKPLLDRAFKETYGLDIRDVLFDEDLALGTYRHGASKTIPHLTKVAWELKRDQIEKLVPGITRRKFVYSFSRRRYEKEYGKNYQGRGVRGRARGYEQRIRQAAHTPGFGAKILAIIFSIIPRIGPLQTLDFKPATPQTERLFLNSLNATRENYRHLLDEVAAGHLSLPDTDFDTGKPTSFGEYPLADRTYADLLARLQKERFKNATPELRANILSFFDRLNAVQPRKDCPACADVPQELKEMQAAPTQPPAEAAANSATTK